MAYSEAPAGACPSSICSARLQTADSPGFRHSPMFLRKISTATTGLPAFSPPPRQNFAMADPVAVAPVATTRTALELKVLIAGSALCAFLAAGCSREDAAPTSPASDAESNDRCNTDKECLGGFCDRDGSCQVTPASSRYGTACERAPELPSGRINGDFNTCGPYLCIDGRCRSCLTDMECFVELGSPQCGSLPDPRFRGTSCGIYVSGDAGSAPGPEEPPEPPPEPSDGEPR